MLVLLCNLVQLMLGECIDLVEGVYFGVHLCLSLCLRHVGIFGDHVTRFLVRAHVARIALCEFPPNILIPFTTTRKLLMVYIYFINPVFINCVFMPVCSRRFVRLLLLLSQIHSQYRQHGTYITPKFWIRMPVFQWK